MSDLTSTALPGSIRSELSSFEFWPGWVFYTPVVIYWIVLGLRYGDFSLPSAANPRITTGGLCGESKSSILDQAGPDACEWIAQYVKLKTGRDDLRRAQALLQRAGLATPLVVKPDIGCNGTGVRLAETEQALAEVLASFPRGVDLLLQELVSYDGEAGIFFIRPPREKEGFISSLTHKRAPILFGDGRSTVRDLVMNDPRTGRIPQIYLPRLENRLAEILPLGTPLRLVFAGNHCKGSIFTNGDIDITAALTATVNRIIDAVPDFHFGRIDVRYESVSALRRGTGFRIIEINGVGSEATHIWDPATRLKQAYRTQFHHYRMAFAIGAAQRAAGARTCGVMTMLRDWVRQRRLMASYPLND